jgi:hypothetical protein
MKDYGTATSSTTPFLAPASKSSESVPIPARKSSESVPIPARKSSESVKHPMNVEEQAPLAELDRKKSTESMVIDDEIAYSPAADDDHFKLIIPFDNNNVPTSEIPGAYLKTKDFNYTMQLMDDKINSLYKLCRYISDQQEKTATSLKKLVALDELSENFWNVSYFTYL